VQNWKLDLSREGDQILFKEYHKAIIDLLLEDPDKGFPSGEMHEAVLEKGIKISRASVIFYLDFLADDGLVSWIEKTGKGGHHRIYKAAKDWEGMKRHIMIRVVEGLGEALDEDIEEIGEVIARWLDE